MWPRVLRTIILGLVLAVLAAVVLTRGGSPGATQAEADGLTLEGSPGLESAAGVQMTLAGIAYVDDNKSLADIKAAIQTELQKTSYATHGDWELVWGPAARGGNLAYIARNKLSPEQYSLAIRGTDFNLLKDDIEDIWLEQEPYPYARGAGRVSRGSLAGLNHLQGMTDSATGQGIRDFLTDRAADAGLDLIVTGHSLGGGLASLVLIWLHDVTPGWGLPADKLHLSAYTFAGQTVGNADFARYFAATLGDDFHRFVNPLDIVPKGYGDLAAILEGELPTAVPLEYRAILEALTAYLFAKGLTFQQVGSEVLLESVPLPSTLPYLEHVMEQHRPNSYLYLLGAPQLEIGRTSLLPHYAP